MCENRVRQLEMIIQDNETQNLQFLSKYYRFSSFTILVLSKSASTLVYDTIPVYFYSYHSPLPSATISDTSYYSYYIFPLS